MKKKEKLTKHFDRYFIEKFVIHCLRVTKTKISSLYLNCIVIISQKNNFRIIRLICLIK